MVSTTPWPLYLGGSGLAPILWEVGWAPGPVWTSEKNLVPTRNRSPNRRARSKSLYRLRYSGPRLSKRKDQSH
jgi:hypothetical protein